MEWSPAHHGVSHLSQPGKKSYATITEYDGFAELLRWTYPVRQPTLERFDSADAAKKAAEMWLKAQAL